MPLSKVPLANQRAHSPGGGDAEGQEEAQAESATAQCALAPALEHGHQSNHKEDEGQAAEQLDPHNYSP
jgi:hypothetical protein